MVDLTRYAPHLLLPIGVWITIANLVAWSRTPPAEKNRRERRFRGVFFPGFLTILFFMMVNMLNNSYLDTIGFIFFYGLVGNGLVFAIPSYVLNRLPPPDYQHAIDILLFRQPLPLEQQTGADPSRRPPQRALAVSGLIGSILLVSVLGVSAQPCGWLDRLIQRSGCIRELTSDMFLVHDVRVSPDGLLVAYGDEDQVQIRRISDGSLVYTLEHAGYKHSLAFSADNALLASGSRDSLVRIWQVKDGTLLRTITTLGDIRRIAFSPDTSLLATEGYYDGVQVWRVADGTLVWEAPEQASNVAFFPDGQRLLIVVSGRLQIWQLANQQLLETLNTPPIAGFRGLTLSADGTLIAGATGVEQVTVWQTATGRALHTIDWPKDAEEQIILVNSVAFSPDGSLIAAGASAQTVRVWRVADGKLIHTFWQIRNVEGLAFAPDGTLLAGSTGGSLRHWKVKP